MQNIAILGSTGSIGQSTLDVIRQHPGEFNVCALVAGSNVTKMLQDAKEFNPQQVVFASSEAAELFNQQAGDLPCKAESGENAAADAVSGNEIDVVMSAIVGAAGLQPTLAAIRAGKKVLLANKESLVMAGQLMMDAVASNDSVLLPIDSEHNAIFQCLPPGKTRQPGEAGISKVILTASGGPFHADHNIDLASVTPEQACAHPNWSMGRKISVDSATLMNKGLEYIEACFLFDLQPGQLEVLVHPQSIVHSMVQYQDGSVLAQMGNPDMRTPIAHALAWPNRISSGVTALDLAKEASLTFQQPDHQRFPALSLAMAAAKRGGSAPAVLNAANEIAVDAFLSGQTTFTSIAALVADVLDHINIVEPQSLDDVLAVDQEARQLSNKLLKKSYLT